MHETIDFTIQAKNNHQHVSKQKIQMAFTSNPFPTHCSHFAPNTFPPKTKAASIFPPNIEPHWKIWMPLVFMVNNGRRQPDLIFLAVIEYDGRSSGANPPLTLKSIISRLILAYKCMNIHIYNNKSIHEPHESHYEGKYLWSVFPFDDPFTSVLSFGVLCPYLFIFTWRVLLIRLVKMCIM